MKFVIKPLKALLCCSVAIKRSESCQAKDAWCTHFTQQSVSQLSNISAGSFNFKPHKPPRPSKSETLDIMILAKLCQAAVAGNRSKYFDHFWKIPSRSS